jgi:DNA-binding transcriptional MerR regulator
MPQLDGIQYLSTKQVADALSISKGTLKNWLREKKITEPGRHPINHYRLWTLKDVETLRLHIRENDEQNEAIA